MAFSILRPRRVSQAVCCAAVLLASGGARMARAEADIARVCLSAPEAREAIGANRLADSLSVMISAAQQTHAEALAAKLCRWDDKFVYEITLLGRDSRVIHVFMNAADGRTVKPRDAN